MSTATLTAPAPSHDRIAKSVDPTTLAIGLKALVELIKMLRKDGPPGASGATGDLDPYDVPKGFDLSKITGLLSGLDIGKLQDAIALLDAGLDLFGKGDLIPDNAPELAAAVANVGEESRELGEALYQLIKEVGNSGKRVAMAIKLALAGQKDAAASKLDKAQGILGKSREDAVAAVAVNLDDLSLAIGLVRELLLPAPSGDLVVPGAPSSP